MPKRRVAITGLGLVTALGESIEQFWENICAGKSGVKTIECFDASQYTSRIGGEITEYTKMLAESREQAIDRMIDAAKAIGADGITCVRFTTSSVMQSAAEILVYGTAVKLTPRAVQ